MRPYASLILIHAVVCAAVIGVLPAGAAPPIPFTVRWNCPQMLPAGTPDLPGDADITLGYLPGDPPRLEWGTWKKIATLAEKSGTDYFRCFSQFEARVQRVVQSACEGKADPGKCSETIVPEVMLPMRRLHTQLGADALKRGALPPYTPGARMDDTTGTWSAAPKAYPRTARVISNLMRDNCTIPTKEEGLAVALSADFLASHLPGVMAGVDKDCQKKIISRYLNASAELQPPVSRCPPDSKDSGCFKFREGDQRLLRALEPYLPKGGMSPEALSDCLAKTGDLSKYFTALDISVASAASCAELLAGESRNIDADVGTGLPAHYRLTKNSDGSFGADLNLRFSPSARQEEFAKTANGCLKKYDSLFKAPPPASGQLHLRVTDEPAGNPAKPPPPTAINITDEEGFRANSENWPSTIDCQTITHELLHKLGLVDEYAEKAMGHVCNSVGEDCKYVASGAKLKEYDCRKEGPEDSIMTDQNAAIDKAQGQPMSGSCTCDSKMNAKRCEKLLNTIPANAEACPKGTDGSVKPEVKLSGFFEMSEDSNPADSSAGAKEKNSEALSKLFKGLKDPSDPKRTKVLKYRKPGSGTIFLPAQFRALTTPGCMATNARLYTCSKAAYSTSLANIGDGCPKGLPDYCDHPAEWTQ